jgi:hypothetical protein
MSMSLGYVVKNIKEMGSFTLYHNDKFVKIIKCRLLH